MKRIKNFILRNLGIKSKKKVIILEYVKLGSKINNSNIKMITLWVLLLFIPIAMGTIQHKEKYKSLTKIEKLKKSDFSINNLREYLLEINSPDPEIILSQFILETGWFKSRLFVDGNNIAGMKMPRKRETTAIGTIYNHAKYSHWTDSVDDFMLWLDYHSLSERYADHLESKCYAQDSEYYNRIISIHKRIKLES